MPRDDYYSSPVAGGGQIYVASLSGKLTVVKAGGEKPEILHQAEFGERIFASPALVGDNLYLRTHSTLYAFGPQNMKMRTSRLSDTVKPLPREGT